MPRTRSKKEQSSIVSGAGYPASFASGLMKEVRAQGGSDEDLYRLVTESGLDTLRQLAALAVSTPAITAPEGGRIHILRVPVNPAREWQEGINAAGPNTPENFDVCKVGGLYLPQKGKVEEREIILVNFGKTIPNGQYALDWAKQYKLCPDGPRGCFAIGEHKPNLDKELGMNPMAVVSLEECSFEGERRVCNVWWDDAGRYASLYWFGDDLGGDYWFAFVRE